MVVQAASVLTLTSLLACGGVDPGWVVGGGPIPCDQDGLCPGTDVCDTSSNTCNPSTGGPDAGGGPCTTPASQQQILIGIGLSCVTVDATRFGEVIALFGPPDNTTVSNLNWLWYDKSLGLEFVPTDSTQNDPTNDELVDTVFVLAPFAGTTPDGLAVGQPRSQVHAVLGTPPEVSTDGQIDKYSCKGVWIEYDASNNLKHFQIFAPFGC